MSDASVRFVLVEPLAAGNVGAAARAIKNLGFRRLDLVRPACDPTSGEARKMAVDASDVLAEARVHPTLDAALEGAATVAGTTGRKGRQRRPHYRLDAVAPDLARFAAAGELAIVFGRETMGLTDAELDRCTHLVYLPAAGDYPSFNLAQSVLLAAYELALAREGPAPPAQDPPATHLEREAMYGHLEQALAAIGFVRDDSTEGMMRRLRRILGRAELSSGDAKIFRGIARQILWLARREPPAGA